MHRFFILLSIGLSLWHWNAHASFDSDADTSVMEGLGWRMDIFSDYQAGALIYWAQLLPQPDGKVVVVDMAAGGLAVNVGRLNNDGTMDTTFGNQGWTTQALNWIPTALEVLLQSDGKIVVAADFGNNTVTLLRFLANGQIDNSFAGNGRLNLTYTGIASLGQQSTGKLILNVWGAGLIRLNTDGSLDNTFNTAQQDWSAHTHIVHSDDSIFIYNASSKTIKHLSADGVLDTSFGSSGVVTLSAGINSSSMAIVSNKLWVGGFYFNAGNFPGIACRLNLNGTLDNSFDGDGCLTFNGNWTLPSTYTLVAGMRINSAEQALFWYQDVVSSTYQAVRFNANGTLDTTFSGDGYYDPINSYISDMALQGNQTLMAGFDQSVPQGLIRRLDSTANLDITFAGDGEYNEIVKTGSTIYLDSVRLSDGKLLAAGVNGNHRLAYSIPPRLYWPSSGGSDFHDASHCVVARYDSNGEPDLSFNGTGHALFVHYLYCALMAARELHDGKYLVAGSSGSAWSGGGYKGLLMHIGSNGKLDNSFGGDGIVEVVADVVYYRIEQQSDDKILVMGIDDSNNGVVIRYNTDGTVDSSYGLNGRLILTASKRFSSAVQADDKLLLYLLDGKLKRFNTDGSLDESFGDKGEVVVNGINNMADFAYGNFLVLKNDGKILLVESTGDSQFRLRQFSDAGIADNSFGTAGMVDLPNIPALLNPPLKYPTDFRMVSLAQDQQGNTIVLGHAGLDSGDYNNYLTQLILLRYSTSGQLDQHLFTASNGVAQPVLSNAWIYPTDIHPDLDKGFWLTGSVHNRDGAGTGVGAGLLFKMKGVADYDNDNIANDIDTDVEGDQLPDSWEINFFNDLWLWNAGSNSDGDAWNMLQELQMNTYPNNPDTDGDGTNDDLDYNPLNVHLQGGGETLPLNQTYKGGVLESDNLGQ